MRFPEYRVNFFISCKPSFFSRCKTSLYTLTLVLAQTIDSRVARLYFAGDFIKLRNIRL